jgi:hypothetical protein
MGMKNIEKTSGKGKIVYVCNRLHKLDLNH